jgi:hypothetical protein
MLLPAGEHNHVGDSREMGREETADRARTDDTSSHANFARRYFGYGSGSMSDPVATSARTAFSRSSGDDFVETVKRPEGRASRADTRGRRRSFYDGLYYSKAFSGYYAREN